jgi:hypothetical protein
LETIDVTRLHALLSDANRTRAIGEGIIKALITDVLRSKLAFDNPAPVVTWSDVGWERVSTWGRSWGRAMLQDFAEVSKMLHDVLVDVSLSEEEQQIIQRLGLRLGD